MARSTRLLALAVLLLGSSCRALIDRQHQQTSAQPIWQEDRLLLDLQILASSDSVLTDRAAYAAAQMDALQPALSESPLVSYGECYNLMAYAAGAHPLLSSELVIVAADFDGPAHRGSLAALLEIARNYAHDAQRGYMPDRTIMVAAFSGFQDNCDGLSAYLRRPLWSLNSTHAIVFLGSKERAAETIAPYGAPFQVVVPSLPGPVQNLEAVARDAIRMAIVADSLLRDLTTVSL